MAKRKTERSRLPDLVAAAAKLQGVAKDLRPHAEESEELDSAMGSTQLALDAIVVEILRNHLSEVEVRLDPHRPQWWEDYFAVLEVVFDGTIIRIPVPKLRAKDAELAEKIRRKITMEKVKIAVKQALHEAPERFEDWLQEKGHTVEWVGHTSNAHKNIGTYGYCGGCGQGNREARSDYQIKVDDVIVDVHYRITYWSIATVDVIFPDGTTATGGWCECACGEKEDEF